MSCCAQREPPVAWVAMPHEAHRACATHRGELLHDFDLGFGAKALREIRAQLFVLALL